jgi:hypothetical protein
MKIFHYIYYLVLLFKLLLFFFLLFLNQEGLKKIGKIFHQNILTQFFIYQIFSLPKKRNLHLKNKSN